METTLLYQKVQRLPPLVQQEVDEYLNNLLSKYLDEVPVRPRAGCMKGTFLQMSDDFNAPLDDFSDYQ